MNNHGKRFKRANRTHNWPYLKPGIICKSIIPNFKSGEPIISSNRRTITSSYYLGVEEIAAVQLNRQLSRRFSQLWITYWPFKPLLRREEPINKRINSFFVDFQIAFDIVLYNQLTIWIATSSPLLLTNKGHYHPAPKVVSLLLRNLCQGVSHVRDFSRTFFSLCSESEISKFLRTLCLVIFNLFCFSQIPKNVVTRNVL